MNTNQFLKAIRMRREMSQKQLADALGLNIMTISRLETKESVKFTPRTMNKIVQFIDEEDLAMLDPSNEQDKKIIEQKRLFTHSDMEPSAQIREEWTSGVITQLEPHMQGMGYTLVERDDGLLYYQNKTNKKNWLFICRPLVKNTLTTHLKAAVGNALLYGYNYEENKITIIIPHSYNMAECKIPNKISQCLPFDLSVLHFDDDGLIQQETYLRFNTDGRGIFDLNVDDTAVNAQAGKDFLTWTKAVGNIIVLEKEAN